MKKIKFLALMLAAVMMLTALAGTAFAEGDKAWAEANGIYRTDETVEELYEQAKLEGEVNIYGCTGRIEDFIPDFEAAYPRNCPGNDNVQQNSISFQPILLYIPSPAE